MGQSRALSPPRPHQTTQLLLWLLLSSVLSIRITSGHHNAVSASHGWLEWQGTRESSNWTLSGQKCGWLVATWGEWLLSEVGTVLKDWVTYCEVCANCIGVEVTQWLSCITHGVHTDLQIKAQTPFSSQHGYISLVNSYKSFHDPPLPEWPISWLQILQCVFRVLSTPTVSQASSCRSVNTPEILFKAHSLVIQRANGCGRLQLAQLCLGFAWMLYLECWILLRAENQKHQQWSVPAPLCFVLCHICCAVGFSSGAGWYIQVSTVPRG